MNNNKRRVYVDPHTGKLIICQRCGRPVSGNAEAWNVIYRNGATVGYLCPDCQTPEENAEAEVNAATIEYGDTVTLDGMAFAQQMQSFAVDYFRAWLEQVADGADGRFEPDAIAGRALSEMVTLYPRGFPVDEALVRSVMADLVRDLYKDAEI